MHYKDGQPAKIGDLVKGKGYNIPGTIVGKLVQMTPNSARCNCIILVATSEKLSRDSYDYDYKLNNAHTMLKVYEGGIVDIDKPAKMEVHAVNARTEYSQLDYLELVHRDEPEEAPASV